MSSPSVRLTLLASMVYADLSHNRAKNGKTTEKLKHTSFKKMYSAREKTNNLNRAFSHPL